MWVDRWSFGRRDQEPATSRKEGSNALRETRGNGGGMEGQLRRPGYGRAVGPVGLD